MFDNSIIKKTRQMWKLKLGFSLTLLGAVALFGGIGILNKPPTAMNAILIIGGLVVGLSSFIFLIVAIRCPHCRAPWFWQGISGHSSSNWLAWLISRAECPKCKK
jgi:uncharacterized membrane-anchored protein